MCTATNVAKGSTLEEIWAELLAHRVLLERLLEARQPAPLSRADRDLLAKALPAIGGAFGSEWFLSRELIASTAPAVRLVLAGLNARQVGRLLRRGEGQPVAGYSIERGASELHANLWRVMHVDGFLGNRNLAVPPAATSGLLK